MLALRNESVIAASKLGLHLRMLSKKLSICRAEISNSSIRGANAAIQVLTSAALSSNVKPLMLKGLVQGVDVLQQRSAAVCKTASICSSSDSSGSSSIGPVDGLTANSLELSMKSRNFGALQLVVPLSAGVN
jgi:hypothetical protein